MATPLEDLQLRRAELTSSWAQLSLVSRAYIEMARFIGDNWPSILRPAAIDLWLQSVDEYGILIAGLNDSVRWLNRANQLVLEGKAEYRPSGTVIGDLDLWGDPEDFEPVPGRLLDAFAGVPGESSTLGIAPLVAALIAVGIIGATGSTVAVSLAVIERTRARREEIRTNLTAITIQAVQTGAISESFGERILRTIDVWTMAEAQKPLLKVDTSGVLTIAALGGFGYLLYRLLSRPAK